MSLIEEVRDVEQRVRARLLELEPLVAQYEPVIAEYQELRRLAERMGLADTGVGSEQMRRDARAAPPPVVAPDAKARPADRGPAGTKRRSAARKATASKAGGPRRPSGGGPGRDELMGVVARRPGITVAEMADQLEVAATALYRPVRELTDAGALIKRGRQLFPAEG
jgi:hypothetical protein